MPNVNDSLIEKLQEVKYRLQGANFAKGIIAPEKQYSDVVSEVCDEFVFIIRQHTAAPDVVLHALRHAIVVAPTEAAVKLYNEAIAAMDNVQTLNTSAPCIQKTPGNEHMGDASTRKDEAGLATAERPSPVISSEICHICDLPLSKKGNEFCSAAHEGRGEIPDIADKWIKEFELSALPAEDYSPRYKVVGINRIRELLHHLFVEQATAREPVLNEVAAVEAMASALNDSKQLENQGFSYNEGLAKVCFKALLPHPATREPVMGEPIYASVISTALLNDPISSAHGLTGRECRALTKVVLKTAGVPHVD